MAYEPRGSFGQTVPDLGSWLSNAVSNVGSSISRFFNSPSPDLSATGINYIPAWEPLATPISTGQATLFGLPNKSYAPAKAPSKNTLRIPRELMTAYPYYGGYGGNPLKREERYRIYSARQGLGEPGFNEDELSSLADVITQMGQEQLAPYMTPEYPPDTGAFNPWPSGGGGDYSGGGGSYGYMGGYSPLLMQLMAQLFSWRV